MLYNDSVYHNIIINALQYKIFKYNYVGKYYLK